MLVGWDNSLAVLKKKRRTLAYLISFLVVFLMAVGGFIASNPGKSAFDSKGVLTGAGSFFGLLTAALLALTLLLAIRLYFTHLSIKSAVKFDVIEERAMAAWLSVDVLGEAQPA